MISRSNTILITAAALVTSLEGCKTPVRMVLTRATGSGAKIQADGVFRPEYPLSNVNMANLKGALKYIQTETIDAATGYDGECNRKNKVAFVLFYQVEMCNPDPTIDFFNSNPYRFLEYGHFLTLDQGQCHGNELCEKLQSNQLGPFVGFQNVETDPRAPTKEAYWYSLPGECPSLPWGKKTKSCIESNPGGKCPTGIHPNGIDCTWSADFLGQVELDQLIGLRSIKNPSTGKNFQSSVEFCQQNMTEFQRDDETYEFVQGLPFWEDPLNPVRNAQRVEKLIDLYHNRDIYPRNIPLPEILDNPPCQINLPECQNCHRDESQQCNTIE